jgi:nitroreductase
MSLEQLIRERRTIRKFNGSPVSQDLLIQLLKKAEQLCPYEGKARWRYIYAGSPVEKERLTGYLLEKITDNKIAKFAMGPLLKPYQKLFSEVPAYIIVLAKREREPLKDDVIYGTVCRILQNFQLLAWEQGLGMAWRTEPFIQNELFFGNIGMQEDERFVGIILLGHFDKAPKGRPRTPAEQRWTVIGGS